jgi:hypothetical protein
VPRDVIKPKCLDSAKERKAGQGQYVPRCKDYQQEVQECIKEAYPDFKARVITKNMYPAKDEILDAQAAGAFLQACN